MKCKIELEGTEFHAFHGCLESERRDGNLFMVDFAGDVEFPEGQADPTASDNLADTVDYAAIYDLVAAEMAIPSDLLEHVAGRIVRAVSEHFPEFSQFSVRVSKRNPPVNGECAWSRVTLYHKN